MRSQLSVLLTKEIQERAVPQGFKDHAAGDYRPDATSWAVLALSAGGADKELIDGARSRLIHGQLKDGRVCISDGHPETFWPTSLAVLAWQGAHRFREAQSSGIHFLLETTGHHKPRAPDAPPGYDGSLRGWPWTSGTHSWVEPTALALFALRIAGYGKHPRVVEAAEMLMNRHLPSGGWNYGNTVVFEQELQPMADTTGIALQALAGGVPRKAADSSLVYLKHQAGRLHTPLSLAWCLLGLSAWGERPVDAETLVGDCLKRQEVYGGYPTSQLCLLLLALLAPSGLGGLFTRREGGMNVS